MRIYNNVNAVSTQNSLSSANIGMTKSLEKLSTGLRINRAADDAAGLSVSEGLRSQIRGSQTVIFEAEEGGNHFMFMENPEKFNRIVGDFMR